MTKGTLSVARLHRAPVNEYIANGAAGTSRRGERDTSVPGPRHRLLQTATKSRKRAVRGLLSRPHGRVAAFEWSIGLIQFPSCQQQSAAATTRRHADAAAPRPPSRPDPDLRLAARSLS